VSGHSGGFGPARPGYQGKRRHASARHAAPRRSLHVLIFPVLPVLAVLVTGLLLQAPSSPPAAAALSFAQAPAPDRAFAALPAPHALAADSTAHLAQLRALVSARRHRAALARRRARAARQAAALAARQQAAAQPSPAATAAPGATGSVTPSSSYEACVIRVESGGNPAAVNPSSGAGGLYQFLPSTWAGLGYASAYPGGAQTAPASVQQQAFDKLYAEAGSAPWAGDGC
jgi:resuscitation-promoting factor RpfC